MPCPSGPRTAVAIPWRQASGRYERPGTARQLMSQKQAHQGPDITHDKRRDQTERKPRIRVCQDFRVRRHDRCHTRLRRSPARASSSQSLVKPAGCHDQHKPTQPAPPDECPGTVPYEQNPQVKGISLGSRDRTRTYNLPVNRRSVTPEIARPLNVVNPLDPHRDWSGA